MKKIFVISLVSIFLLSGCGDNKENKIKNEIESCPNCVYTYDYHKENKIGDKLINYKKDYTSLNHNIFLGHILDDEDKILRNFICMVNEDKKFCIEGNINETIYELNKKILNKIYENCKEEKYDDKKYYTCESNINIIKISNKDYNSISNSKSDSCSIDNNGTSSCYNNSILDEKI